MVAVVVAGVVLDVCIVDVAVDVEVEAWSGMAPCSEKRRVSSAFG